MEIREISVQYLEEYVFAEQLELADVVPITPERVRSQQLNPRATPEDILLWVAVSDEGEIVGFAGSLPAWDRWNERRMGWNTCWWVDPDRGRQAALPLMAKFLKYWEYHVAFADMTPHTQSIIRHLDFCHIRRILLEQHIFRLSAKKISSRAGKAGRLLYPLVLAFSSFFNMIQDIRTGLASRGVEELELESRDRLDDEIFSFIGRHREKDFSQRSREEFEWIMEYPWLVNRTDSTVAWADRYPFSYEADYFHMEWILSRRKGTITSVMFTSIRDWNLKVLYYFGTEPEDAIRALQHKIRSGRKIRSLVYAHPALVSGGKILRSLSLWTRKRDRYIGISRKIMDHLPEGLVMQLGDGDSVFT